MAVMIDKETKERVPVTAFLNADRLSTDIRTLTDAARGKFWSAFGMALSVMRNYRFVQVPDPLHAQGLPREIRQDLQRDREELRQGHR